MAKDKSQLNLIAYSAAFSIMWAAFIFCIGLTAAYLNWGNGIVTAMSTLYLGYDATLIGAIIGGIWALIDGAVGGAIFAVVYNYVAKMTK